MLDKNNAHFEELRTIGHEFEEKRRAHDAKKQETIDTYGWDSDEVKAWYNKQREMIYPIPAGACKAYRAWMQSLENENEELQMDDFLWDKEVEDFVETLRKAGIGSFIYTNDSTALMRNLHELASTGCRMDGLCTLTRLERSFGEEREEKILGIHFTVC